LAAPRGTELQEIFGTIIPAGCEPLWRFCPANTFNIGADLGAMADASRLLLPAIPIWGYLLFFSAICMAGQVIFHHSRYVSNLKWLTLSLFSYFAVLCTVHVSWLQLLKGLVWPSLTLDRDFWLMVVAILGTTISPYLFFWQAAQEVEEDTKAEPVEAPLLRRPGQGPAALARIRLDTLIGMGISNWWLSRLWRLPRPPFMFTV
jgi:Mn2+/Fe2+ NRAMP family transporter